MNHFKLSQLPDKQFCRIVCTKNLSRLKFCRTRLESKARTKTNFLRTKLLKTESEPLLFYFSSDEFVMVEKSKCRVFEATLLIAASSHLSYFLSLSLSFSLNLSLFLFMPLSLPPSFSYFSAKWQPFSKNNLTRL